MSRRRNATAARFSKMRHDQRLSAPLASDASPGLRTLPPTGLICPRCRHVVDARVATKGPHLGAFCATCGAWIKWLSKHEQHQPEGKPVANPAASTKTYGDKTAGLPGVRPGPGHIQSAGAESVKARP